MPATAPYAMVEPSSATTLAFVAIVIGVCVLLVVGTWRAAELAGEPPRRVRALSARTALGIAAWLVLTGVASGSGVLETSTTPPRLMIFFLASQAVAIAAAFGPLGTRLAQLPVAALVGFQAFRFPLELILHAWVEGGTLPSQMTYTGHNFDIVSGALALPVAWLVARRPTARWAVLGFNLIGFALLLNVARIAVFSSPLPIRSYLAGPPVLLAFYFPYGWIVPICVGGALFGHLLVFRWLARS